MNEVQVVEHKLEKVNGELKLKRYKLAKPESLPDKYEYQLYRMALICLTICFAVLVVGVTVMTMN